MDAASALLNRKHGKSYHISRASSRNGRPRHGAPSAPPPDPRLPAAVGPAVPFHGKEKVALVISLRQYRGSKTEAPGVFSTP